MRFGEQREYRHAIAQEIASWGPGAWPAGDPWRAGIERLPAYFDGLALLSGRPGLSEHQRRVVHRVVKYLVSPLDLLPELIHGPTGFREDLALVAMAVARFESELGAAALAGAGLSTGDEALRAALDRAETDLDEDVRRHLALLLEADSVAGDEDLARAGPEVTAEPGPAPGDHMMVFAGPGTGKTHRLEEELHRLVVEEGVPPQQILVTTFTNKAADELRVRIRQRLEAAGGDLDVDRALQTLTISTIHAFCFKLIGDFHHHALFLKGAHAPMDETQRMLFLFRYGIGPLKLKEIYPDWKAGQHQADGWRPTDLFHFYAYVGEIYDCLSEDVMRGAEPELRRRYLGLIQADGAETVDERIIRTYPRYWRLVQEEGYLDHSMMLAYAEALLDDPQVRRRVQARYRHVLVDEYQDTNPIQDRIFRLLTGNRSGRLFAVGDDDQSIYAFRGADVRNATRFTERWPGACVETLNESRRSTKRLVEATQQLIERNRTRQPKDLRTSNAEGVHPWRLEAPWKALPEAVADHLQRMKAGGCIARWDEAAILFRGLSRRVAGYREALDEAGIPNALAGDRRFLKRPVVKALLKIFDLAAGDAGEITNKKRAHRPFFEALGWTDRGAMVDTIREWHRAVHEGRYESLLELYYAILNDAGALEAEPLLPDLGHLSGFIAAAEEQLRSPDFAKRLSYFLRYADAATGSFAGPEPAVEDAVQIMTMHKAKGLEFPVVVVADAAEGVIPAHFPEDVRTRLRRDLAGLAPELDPLEEERRVLYVALTRAERHAVLATDPATPSTFLEEIPTASVPEAPAPVEGRRDGRVPRAPPVHLSHGEVYNYDFCPKRYVLESCYGFAGQAIAPIRTGQSLHRALEIYHRLKAEGERVTSHRRRLVFERAWIRPRDTKKAQKEHDRLLGVFERYADRWEAQERRMRIIEAEQPFYAAQQSGVLTGRIDLVRERDDALEIVEVKFHANPMMRDYPTRQLHHYELAYPREQPRLFVHYLKEDREEEVEPRDPEAVREELCKTFENVRQGLFTPSPAPSRCRLCPVRHACSDRADR